MSEESRVDIVAALRRHAAETPDRTALAWLDGLSEPVATLTCGALDDAAAAVAAGVREHARPGDRVLLVQPPGLEFVTSFVGSLYAGCVPVPVYPLLDTEENVAKVRRVLTDSGAALAWTGGPELARHVSGVLEVPAHWETGAARLRPDGPADPDSLAFLQYTSGSTADPRGVMVTHGNLAANLAAIRAAFRHGPDSAVLSWLPAYHDMGLIGNILHPLHTGFAAYLASPLDFIRDPLSWLGSVARYGVTTSGAPNFAYELVVKTLRREGVPEVDLSGWRTAYCGAEPVSRQTLAEFADLLAPAGFRREAFVPCYGLAESTLLVTSVPVGGTLTARQAPDGQEIVSCGVARDCAVAVVDPAGVALPDGEVGEIAVCGPSVAAGYFGRPADTGRTFGSVVDGRPGRWLRTGDLGLLERGELYVTGRIKDVIVVRGRNHHPQDLERLVTRRCPAVRPGGVAAFASAAGDAAVVVAELRPGRELTAADRLAVATSASADLGLAVAEILGVPRGTVPKTTSGKLRRAECRTRYLAGAYREYRSTVDERQAAPAVDAAGLVRAAVREVLDLDVPVGDPLVARGLDSLRAVRLAELLHRATGADVPVRTLLRGATTAELIALAAGGSRPGAAEPEPGHGRLTKAQESLLFLNMLDPASDEYTVSFAWRPGEDTDLAVFEDALRRAVSWRPELGVRIAPAGRGWRRVPVEPSILRDALALTPVPVPDERVTEQLELAAAQPFDIDRGPLLRLYRWQAPSGPVYQLVVHHVVTDLWSLCLVLRDIGTCYADLLAGRVPVAPPATSYDAYVTEQEEYLASAAAEARDEELRSLLPVRARSVDIRTDRPHRSRRRPAAGRVTAALDTGRTAAAAPADDLVGTMILLWAATLHRYGTPNPVVVGVPVTGRVHGRHGTVAGLCTNTVPIAADLDPDRALASLVVSVRDQLERGMDAGLYPLARAVEAVRPERAAGRHPLVETLITIQENPMPDVPGVLDTLGGLPAELKLGPLSLSTVPVPRRTCRYDLDLIVTPRPDGYLLTLDYAADLFDELTAESVLSSFQTAVAAALANPDADLGDVLLLSERDENLLARMGTGDAPRLDPPPLARIRRLATEYPDRPAVQDPAGTRGYRDFVTGMDRIGAALAGLTGSAGTSGPRHAALLLDSPADFALAMYGAWAAGLGVLPLPPDHPDGRLEHMLADQLPCAVLSSAALAPRARRLAAVGGTDAPPVLVLEDLLDGPVGVLPPPPDDAPAYTVYTSGSTGLPKGVPIRQDQLAHLIAFSEREWRLGPWVRIAQTLSLGFDFGLQELFTMLPTGGCVVVPDPAERRSAREYVRFLRRARITVLFCTPSFATELAATSLPLPDLRLVLLGGEVLRRSTVTALRALVGPGCRLYNGYGPTEATVNCLMYEIGWQVPDEDLPEVLPVGTATSAARIHLVDPADRPVPVGAPGELLIGGPGVAEGYLGRPELTAERFVRLDLDTGPLYRTGDLGYARPDGVYVVTGRADRQVKVRGFRVEPGEVEHVLRGVPGVRTAVVRVIGDPGELTAFLVGDADPGDVLRHAAGFLSPAMVPTRVVPLPTLPLTANGKLDEEALAAAGASVRALPGSASPAEIEAAVCAVWAAALSVSTVDSEANVFDLGAHSLIVTWVHSRLQASAGIAFPVHEIFEHPCPRDLARRITAHRRSAGGRSVPAGQSAANAKEEQ